MWKPLEAGDVVDNRYDIAYGPNERPELMGGMGCVYLCIDRRMRRRVALKTFRPELTGHAVRDRLLRETATWVRLGAHEHIVQVLGLCIPDDGSLYLVLQAGGPSLRSGGMRVVPPGAALKLALHVAWGMAYAVQRVPGIVHRDLKPENILIGEDGISKVTDFGLAQTAAALDRAATQDASLRRTFIKNGIAGTPAYMAPEQWLGAAIDQRADIYALGCILKEVLTGRSPVPGDSVDDIAEAHLRGRAADVSGVAPSVQQLLRRMLAPLSDARYSSWPNVVAALEDAYFNSSGNRLRDAPTIPSESALKDEADAFQGIGHAYLRIGNRSAAADAFAHARGLAERAGDDDLTIRTAYDEATLLIESEQPHRAIPLLRSLIGWYLSKRRLGDAARCLGNLGQAQRKTGDLTGALRASEDALEILRKLDDRFAVATELLHKANTHGLLQQYDEAVECHKESALVADALGNEALVGMNTLRIGLLLAAAGNTTAGRVTLRYANLLYLRAGRKDYAEEVAQVRERFITNGMFSQEPFELGLDALFAVVPDPNAVAEVALKHPTILDAEVIGSLLHATAAKVGTECVARAIREQGTILAAISLASRRI